MLKTSDAEFSDAEISINPARRLAERRARGIIVFVRRRHPAFPVSAGGNREKYAFRMEKRRADRLSEKHSSSGNPAGKSGGENPAPAAAAAFLDERFPRAR